VFGSGQLTIPQMARAGIWMNLLSIVLVTVILPAAPAGATVPGDERADRLRGSSGDIT
jgi:hypothetical protein